ncbi:YkgJ family cysteine cluster protein [Dyella acidiphila]|uniref:YkgJ family cysteine cluster protein n=1 Tax=Dyella acidiphila TaxID=2775866 RepID=A0ABR9GFF9_9GAMM|nr:YkgJ family cysteine cluster protein [Dyella acidiphila]MBE1162780.1 YkgJ family cysteine cluster protein [Dyella acidiphila]
MKAQADELAAKIVDAVLEERCASEEGMRRYRPLLEERAHRIVARLVIDPGEESESNDDPLHQIHALFKLADATVKDELGSHRYPKPACPDSGGCSMCCTHMRIVLSAQEACAIAKELLGLTEPEKAEIARRLPSLGKSGPGSQCGLLDEQGLCTLYAARPINCRTHRSCSITACEDRVRLGRNAGEEVVFAYPFDDLVRKSFHHAVQPGGTPHFLEMNTFLSNVLHDKESLAAWASGQIPAEHGA